MKCSENQIEQLERILSCALYEIRDRAAAGENQAASDLAYACHNIPGCHRNDHFDWAYFEEWFASYFTNHGARVYNYLGMLDAARDDTEITSEIMLVSDAEPSGDTT